ncbi:MAG: transposase [Oscillospiraceae bacterium]|nr:transposase [Oscillospiraceae bacterium]
MKYTPKFLRGVLLSMIRKIGEHPEQYVRQHGWNLWHMSALFDLENGIYTDLIVQKEHEKNECSALSQMAGRSRVTGKVILLADRNYESCNNLALLEKRNWNYLIRIRDKARGIAYGMPLHDRPEFDIPLKLTLGRLTPRQLETRGIAVPKPYYRIPPTITFDFLESNSPDFYEISFRVVRLQTDSGNTETLVTNLGSDRFPLAALKVLCARRWGIETSFRSLKYAVGLIHLHAKKPDLVLQEVFANFLVFNFTQAAAWAVP